jgi:hypothetical protein
MPEQWINIWSPLDIISGALDDYDITGVPDRENKGVQNKIDNDVDCPLLAHNQYWENDLFMRILYDECRKG